MEIERKWMVKGWPQANYPLVSEQSMRQGYVSVSPTVRIREEALKDGETEYILCFKSSGGLARKEIEMAVPKEKFLELEDLIGRIMDAFREGKPQSFGEFKVQKTVDYLHGYEDIPASNVLIFDLGDGTWFAMRPSGTEPKIKFYYYAVSDNEETSKERVASIRHEVDSMIEQIK